MNAQIDPKASVKTIRSFAFKVLKRLHALGAKSQTIDDAEQELWIAWCKARDNFNPELGVTFNTYLHSVMRNHINRHIVLNFERFHEQTVALSLDLEVGGESSGEGANMELHDVLADTATPVAELVEGQSVFAYACNRLSPRARSFVTVLNEQPQELLDEVLRLNEKSTHAQSLGVAYAQPRRLTSAMVFDLMQASRVERTTILAEITQLGDILSRTE
jgi:DNA-directed RNA polymerase specialized sigma24 family protein